MLKARLRSRGGDAVRRRAAGDRDRPRADDQSAPAAARRGLARPVAAGRRRRLRSLAEPDRRGATTIVLVEQDLNARAQRRRPRRSACWRARIVLEGAAAELTREQVTEPISACGAASGGRRDLFWVNQSPGCCSAAITRCSPAACRFMFGVMRIINLAHGSLAVLAAYLLWSRRAASTSRRSWRLLAVLPVMALVGWALQRLVLERSLRGAAGAAAEHLRTGDRDRQPAVRGLRRRHALARALYRRSRLRQLADHRRHRSSASSRADLGGGVALLGGCSCSSSARRSAAPSAPPRRIPTPPSWSASMRGASTRGPPRSPWRRSRSPAACSWRCARPSIPIPDPTQLIFAFEAVGDRRRRLALGHAGRRHRARRRADDRRADQSRRASSSPATSSCSCCSRAAWSTCAG
jgi:hypothetical protein